ncbi:MAG TPA: protease complex subunit PrcB family protein [Steroidobacteraceae bacterium]|nr:protease complex subunit PrcB family protein [Steroidobacteraceae bacterium]
MLDAEELQQSFVMVWHRFRAMSPMCQCRLFNSVHRLVDRVSGPAEPTYQAITTREQWVQFWKQLRVGSERFVHGPTPRTDEAPEFDFKQVTLIVAGAGTKPMSGYSIAIQRIWDDSVNIRVSIEETSPGRNCAGTTISTAPFVGATIPATTKKVVFDISKAETVCN